MRIGIFGSDYQAGKQTSIIRLFDRLLSFEAEIWVEKHFYNYLSKTFAFTPLIAGLINQNQFPLDMVFSLGGDGTFLRTAGWVDRQGIPILGINTGRLGFLADTGTDEIDDTLNDLFQGKYQIENRTLLQLQTTVLNQGEDNYALNEIAILKRETSAMITIQTYLNNLFLTEYLADGLLLSTPTGSTAYNLSVNGPIIVPQSNNFVLTPVAPHSLNVRPLVIPEDYKIRFRVESRNKNYLVALDGRSKIFPSGSEFEAVKADYTVKVVKRLNRNFYETLRKKLLWGTDVRKNMNK
ncbi:MAG: NAD kinase [Dysgonamonadaceae bacterium]|jgi:NAD+ kinase|nr:NAD kinase [Dysgonamonadaceae bacterium]